MKKDYYNFFDEKKVSDKITDYKQKNISCIHFFIPTIHCGSCVFSLETLPKYNKYILYSFVDINYKKIWITYDNRKIKISELAFILDNIGFSPSTNLESIEEKKEEKLNNILFNRRILGKIVISFFCFGNIMLLAIPEYIGSLEDLWYINNRNFFRFTMLTLSIPIVILSFNDYIKSAFLELKKFIININIPISIGIIVLFFWSSYEIFFDISQGYFDSLSGFYLFLLISRLFHTYTHDKIFSFNKKSYKSFYPVLITKVSNQKKEEKVFLSSIKKNDLILIRNEEIIPVDSILVKGRALLDNSFITGESYLIKKNIGEKIYAGSKHKGEILQLKVLKEMDHSYLSILWKKNKSKKRLKKEKSNLILNKYSKYFTLLILSISIFSGLYWFIKGNIRNIFQSTFSVLIITCPCSIVLSSPLIFGNIIKFLSKKGFYVKNIFTMEKMSYITTLVFDKTGTLTDPNKEKLIFFGKINYNEKKMIASLLRNSNHPLSQKILKTLSINNFFLIKNFLEIPGKGLKCTINNFSVKIGSPKFLGMKFKNEKTVVAVSIKEKLLGYFIFGNFYRKKIKNIFKKLKNYKIVILSGDNNKLEKKYLKSIFSNSLKILFNQNPEEKSSYIKKLQKNGEKVMMFGDGINDCAALNQSDIGVAVSDQPTNFFPNCDVFLQSKNIDKIYYFLKISKISRKLVITNLIISLLYNIIGIIFAVSGKLSPFLSAILMPISSFTVIIFSVLSTWIFSKKFLSF